MSSYRDLVQVQPACEWADGFAIQPSQFIHNELQILQPHRQSHGQALLIATPRALCKVTTKNRLHKSSIGELDGCCLVGVIYRSYHVTTACKVFKKERVIRERTRVTVREDDHRM